MTKPSVIFLGTPEFSVPTLEALIQQKYDIRLVITQPDRPRGRGQKLSPSPVKEIALREGLPVFQPESLRKDPSQLLQTPADFLIVIAYGQILSAEVLAHPRLAPLNVHASLLPAYRGAAPIARSIIEGDETTGITVQWMIEALDQGDILFQLPCHITETDTAAALHDRLKILGADALIKTLELFESDRIVRRSQDARVGSYAAKLQKEEGKISFHQPAHQVHRLIMGLNPWPVAECQLTGKVLRIFISEPIAREHHSEPGTVLDTSDGKIVVACSTGCVGLLEVQMENRKRLLAKDFLLGHPIPKGLVLGATTHGK